MRYIILSLWLMVAPCHAYEVEDHQVFGTGDGAVLRVISTADIAYFEPMILSFLDSNPDMRVDYTVASSTELMKAVYAEAEPFDLAISSAMDLQTKIANDGKALSYSPAAAPDFPDWMVWNNMIFAFTQEPAAMVLSKKDFTDIPTPRTRQELISTLRRYPDRFRGRIGTYDVRRSGLGYLFATQDARTSDTFWRLTEVMGALDAQLYCCSSDMIEGVENGSLAIAYNVLGSYAAGRQADDLFEIVLPHDFTTTMLRTVLIPSTSATPDLAGTFIDHLLENAAAHGSSPLVQDYFADGTNSPLQRIRLGPGLLVYLDRYKKDRFLKEWLDAIDQQHLP